MSINTTPNLTPESSGDNVLNNQTPLNSMSSLSQPVWQPFLMPVAILLGSIIISSTIIFTRGSSGSDAYVEPTPEAPVEISLSDADHVLGNKDAKVTIVEYSDLECPFCRRFFEGAYAEVKKNYVDTGKAKLVFRHYPLPFHPHASLFAEATECSAKQGGDKFWAMHDKLFQEQGKQEESAAKLAQQGRQAPQKKWTDRDMITYAGQLKLNTGDFAKCMQSDETLAKIQADQTSGDGFGVNGTPTSFVNGNRLVGAQPFAAFKAIIDAELEK